MKLRSGVSCVPPSESNWLVAARSGRLARSIGVIVSWLLFQLITVIYRNIGIRLWALVILWLVSIALIQTPWARTSSKANPLASRGTGLSQLYTSSYSGEKKWLAGIAMGTIKALVHNAMIVTAMTSICPIVFCLNILSNAYL